MYASLRISIYGTGSTNGDGHETHGEGYVGIWNFETATLDGARKVGYNLDWYSTSVIAQDHVTSDRKVQTWARADQADYGLVTYTKMKLTYKYGNLDY